MKFLIVGLGNIGEEYAHTRHNIGFDVVAALVQKHGGKFRQERLAYVAEIKWKGRLMVCVCPTTYMNLSGKAFKYWVEKEKLTLDKTLTVVDELSLPITKLRLRGSGSAGGHNGLKSIEASVQTQNYPRLRFGIGNGFKPGTQIDFVLGKWQREEEAVVAQKIQMAVGAIELFITQGLAAAMTSINNQEYKG
ncbi:aminoacyl-tRNA hydrolase [Niabella terrae]